MWWCWRHHTISDPAGAACDYTGKDRLSRFGERVKPSLDQRTRSLTPAPEVVYALGVGVCHTSREQPRDEEAHEDHNVIKSKAPPPAKRKPAKPDYKRKPPPADPNADYHYRDVCKVFGCTLRTAKRYVRRGQIPAPDYKQGRAVWDRQRLVEMFEEGVQIANNYPLQHSVKAAIARKAYRAKLAHVAAKKRKKGRAK